VSSAGRVRVKVVGWFQFLVGVAMLGLWARLLATGGVPEIEAGQRDIWFHVAAEAIAAVALIIGGLALFRSGGAARFVLSAFACGALLYTSVNSAGYYADRGEWGPVGMFGLLALLAVVGMIRVVRAVTSVSEVSMGRERELVG
jgi:hypothetical protein